MGYAGSALREAGATLTSAQFIDVGSKDDDIKLGSIIPIAAKGVDLGGNIEIQFLNFDGSSDMDNDYYWDGESTWLKDGSDEANDVVIPAGHGLWVSNTSGAPVSLRSSGQVNEKEILFPIRTAGATAAANAFPVDTTFGKVVPIADAGVDLGGNIEIQYLNFDGSSDMDNDYYWDGESTWLKDGSDEANDVVIPAGRGLWVSNTAGAPVSIQITAPEL